MDGANMKLDKALKFAQTSEKRDWVIQNDKFGIVISVEAWMDCGWGCSTFIDPKDLSVGQFDKLRKKLTKKQAPK